MVKIQYLKSVSGLDNCFELFFSHNEYIPQRFYEESADGTGAELHFYICLFEHLGLFDKRKEYCHEAIWSCLYDCIYKDIPFTMCYDEDYDMVSFSVNETHLSNRSEIAEYIRSEIEKNKSDNFKYKKPRTI